MSFLITRKIDNSSDGKPAICSRLRRAVVGINEDDDPHRGPRILSSCDVTFGASNGRGGEMDG